MRYENYERRIRVLKKATDLLHSIRFWVIGGVSLAAVSTTTVLGVEGTTKIEEVPETIVYGEVFTPTTFAVMGDSTIEYAVQGTNEWFTIQPTMVGKYKARSVSQNGYGATTYSKEENFEIVPKKIQATVNGESVVYGETPRVTLNASDLVRGDKLDAGYTVDLDLPSDDAMTYNAKLAEKGYQILSEEGNDVTFCYDVERLEKELKIITRPLNIEFDSANRDYNGEALTCTTFADIGEQLADGDHIVDLQGKSITDIGSIDNEVSFRIFDSKEKDVTRFYKISPKFGKLTVNRIAFPIKTNDVKRDYDGTDLSDELTAEFDSSKLLPGHTLEIDYSQSALLEPMSDEVAVPNGISYKFLDSEGNLVNDYYDPQIETGSIYISKRHYSYSTNGKEMLYDGLVFKDDTINVGEGSSLVEGHRAVWSAAEGYTNPTFDENGKVTTTKNIIKLTILDVFDNDVTSFYDINAEYGDVMVKQRSVKFDMPSYNNVYDGEEHYLFEPKVDMTFGDKLLPTHTAYIEDPIVCRDAKEYSTAKSKVKIVDDAGVDVTSFYDISYTHYASKVAQQELTISLNKLEKEYDGDALIEEGTYAADSTYEIVQGKVAGTEKIKAKYLQTVKSEGEGTYQVEVDVVDQEETRSTKSNYILRATEGQYSVTKTTLVIATMPYEKTYDGTNKLTYYNSASDSLVEMTASEQEGRVWEVQSGKVHDNDEWSQKPVFQFKTGEGTHYNAGGYVLERDTSKAPALRDKTSKTPTTSNYNIVYQLNNKANIKKRSISIGPLQSSFEYDGKDHSMHGTWKQTTSTKIEKSDDITFDVTGKLAVGDTVTVAKHDTIMTCADSGKDIVFTPISITNSSGVDVYTTNTDYNVTYSDTNKYTITQRKISVFTDSAEQVFNNQVLTQNGYEIVSDDGLGLGEGDKVKITWPEESEYATCRPTTVADSSDPEKMYNKYKSIQIMHDDGTGKETDVTSSYEITPVYGLLNIRKMRIAVKYNDISVKYSGKDYSFDKFEVLGGTTEKGVTLVNTDRLDNGVMIDAKPDNFHVYANKISSAEKCIWVKEGGYSLDSLMYFSVEDTGKNVLMADSRVSTESDNFTFYKMATDRKLTYTEQTVTIKSMGGTYLYDGSTAASERISVRNLCENDKIYFYDAGSYTPLDSYTNAAAVSSSSLEEYVEGKKAYTCVSDKIDTGTYTFNIPSYVILQQQTDGTFKNVTNCYTASITTGTIRIIVE